MKIALLRVDDETSVHLSKAEAIASLKDDFHASITIEKLDSEDDDVFLRNMIDLLNAVVRIDEYDLGPVEVLITGHPGNGFDFYGPFPEGKAWDIAGYFDYAFFAELRDADKAQGTTYVLNEDNQLVEDDVPITERINRLGFPVNKIMFLGDTFRQMLSNVGMLTVTRALAERLSDTDDEYRIVGLVSSERNTVIHEPMLVRYRDTREVDLLCRLDLIGDYQIATWEIPKLFVAMTGDTSADAVASTIFDDAVEAVIDFTKGS